MVAPLVHLLIVCAIIGIAYWITTLIPMPPPIRVVAQVAVAIVAIVLLCGLLGVVPGWRLRY